MGEARRKRKKGQQVRERVRVEGVALTRVVFGVPPILQPELVQFDRNQEETFGGPVHFLRRKHLLKVDGGVAAHNPNLFLRGNIEAHALLAQQGLCEISYITGDMFVEGDHPVVGKRCRAWTEALGLRFFDFTDLVDDATVWHPGLVEEGALALRHLTDDEVARCMADDGWLFTHRSLSWLSPMEPEQ